MTVVELGIKGAVLAVSLSEVGMEANKANGETMNGHEKARKDTKKGVLEGKSKSDGSAQSPVVCWSTDMAFCQYRGSLGGGDVGWWFESRLGRAEVRRLLVNRNSVLPISRGWLSAVRGCGFSMFAVSWISLSGLIAAIIGTMARPMGPFQVVAEADFNTVQVYTFRAKIQ